MKLLAFVLIGVTAATAVLADTRPFTENFNRLSERKWAISDWAGPGQARNHTGLFVTDNVDIIDGMLRLRLDQTRDSRGNYVSTGAEIISNRHFGYGVYEFRMRASSTAEQPTQIGRAVRGSVSAAFVYEEGVNTEIDIEFEGNERQGVTHLLSWVNKNYRDNQHTQLRLPGPSPFEQFYRYRIVWQPGTVTYYRDDVRIAQHHNVVPSQPGPMIFNHWGSNSQWWGGWATPGETRYVYIDWFKYRPFSK